MTDEETPLYPPTEVEGNQAVKSPPCPPSRAGGRRRVPLQTGENDVEMQSSSSLRSEVPAARHRFFYVKVAALFYVVWIVVIEVVGRFAATLPGADLTTSFDQRIPLLPGFVWVYQICYYFPLLPLVIAQDWHRFNRGLLAIVVANLPALAMYLLVPVHIARPELGHSLSERVLHFIYTTDYQPSANKLPSLHVVFAWLVFLMCRRQGLPRWGEWTVGALAILISLSTLFIKQHILYDVVSGTVWAFAAWGLAGKLYARWRQPEWDAPTTIKAIGRRMAPALLIGAALLILLSRIVPMY
jgi:membrane-associated phospholipid phosphatase